MAKGTAYCTCAKCGKTFKIEKVCYNRADANQWEAWATDHYDECTDCYKARKAAEREAENAKSAEAASEKGWPELTGTERQVAWATTIREKEVEGLMRYRRESKRYPNAVQAFDTCLAALLAKRTAASWWIDNRGAVLTPFAELLREYHENPEAFTSAEAAEEAAKEDTATIAEPQDKRHEGVVEITAAETQVSAQYRKDSSFRAVVKDLGYTWNGERWALKIGVKTGSSAERAAELGNKLLNAGFAIRIQDTDTLARAIRGDYAPMCRRWITRATGEETFIVSWGRDDDLYTQAKRLPGARYSSPDILVPGREVSAVLDFAHIYGFRLSPGALELVAEMQRSTVVVTPAAAKKPEYEEHPLSAVLDSSRDVLEDLRD